LKHGGRPKTTTKGKKGSRVSCATKSNEIQGGREDSQVFFYTDSKEIFFGVSKSGAFYLSSNENGLIFLSSAKECLTSKL